MNAATVWVRRLVQVALPVLVCLPLPGVPAPPLPEYVFVADTDRRVGFLRGTAIVIGKLDAQGDFHESERDDLRWTGPVVSQPDGSVWVQGHLIRPYSNITVRGPAFEYRSETLVRGTMDTGVFVADPKAPTIRFQDYKYSPKEPRIWNLPGYFMRRDKLEERRKWLAEHLAENPDYAKEKAKLDAAVGDKK